MIRGIIFDMDGVLVLGANKFHLEAWKKAFEENNVSINLISEEEYALLEGMKGKEIQSIILKKSNLTLSEEVREKIYQRKKEIFAEIDNPDTPDTTKELLHNLKGNGFRLAVASGNNRIVIDNFLQKKQLEHIFDATITGDDVKNGKPDPEIFLKALEKLGLSKNEVLIVENTPLGISAAKASGMYTIAITSTIPKEILRHADKIIDSLEEIPQILQTL